MQLKKNLRLILVRHGESVWNHLNLYTGWSNPSLTQKGIKECLTAAQILASKSINFTQGYCSYLDRSIETYNLIVNHLHELQGCLLSSLIPKFAP